jgi:hypothetical protein
MKKYFIRLSFILLTIINIYCTNNQLPYDEYRAIIDSDSLRAALFNTDKSFKLEQKDLITIDSIIIDSLVNKAHVFNGLDGVYRQYIPYVDASGEKKVWVNFFCLVLEEPGSKEFDWKNNVIIVDDGGSCYFNLTVLPKKGKIENLNINNI